MSDLDEAFVNDRVEGHDGRLWVEMVQALPQLHLSDEAEVQTKAGGKYSYQYASLPSILETIRPTLVEHRWVVTQDVTTSDGGQPQVTTLFDHESGAQRRYGPLTVPAGSGAQGVGSAITYARRYALVAALGLAPDGDDDGAAASRPASSGDDEVASADASQDAWNRVSALEGVTEDTATDLWWKTLEALEMKAGDIRSSDVGRVVHQARKLLGLK